MIACLFQRLLNLLDLVADRLAKGLSGMRTHDLLMAKEGVGTIVHQHCAAKGGVGCKRQAGELPPHDVCQTQACQIRQFQIRCALKDMDAGICTTVRRAYLRHIRHCAHTKAIQHDHNKLSHMKKTSFPIIPEPGLPVRSKALPARVFPRTVPLPPPPGCGSQKTVSGTP